MKKIFPFIVALLVAYYIYGQHSYDDEVVDSTHSEPHEAPRTIGAPMPGADDDGSSDAKLKRAHDERRTDYQVAGSGTVTRILPDDNDGSRHQRFVIELDSGQTLMIAHNIDLAPRIEDLEVGDRVAFFGEYEWNSRGGVIHWTHYDPQGRHVAGWLEKDGRRYQ